MLAFVLSDDRGQYFVKRQPNWNHGCGGNETSNLLDDAKVFQAEYDKDGTLHVSDTMPEGDWKARGVSVGLKETPS